MNLSQFAIIMKTKIVQLLFVNIYTPLRLQSMSTCLKNIINVQYICKPISLMFH